MPCYNILGIEICIPSLDDIVNAVVSPITSVINSTATTIINTLTPLFDNIINTLTPLFDTVTTNLSSLFSDLINNVMASIGNIAVTLGDLTTQIFLWIQNAINNINNTVAGIGNNIMGAINGAAAAIDSTVNNIGATLSTAIEAMPETVATLFDGAMNIISGAMTSLFSGFGVVDLTSAGDQALTLSSAISASLVETLASHSPITPEEAASETIRLRHIQRDYWYQLYITALAIEGMSLGQVDGPTTMLFQAPDIRAALDLAADWYKAAYEIGWKPLLERFYLASWTPKIPPYQDLISIYVREGYMPEKWVEFPEEMGKWFRELGYDEYWAKRLWGKHWVLPSPTQLYEMLHRTYGTQPEIGVTTEVLRKMLKLHDYEPEWRPRLEAISWRTWRIYDLRTGWEMGVLSDELLEKKIIDTGFHPDDAPLIADVQKLFVLRSEIEDLVRESVRDYVEGWITEDQLKADLDATPYNELVKQLRLERAKLRRQREIKKDIKKSLIDRYIKGDLTREELAQELSRLGLDETIISAEIEKADARKLRRVRTETTREYRPLPLSHYERAFQRGLITEAQFREKLKALKIAPDDIELAVKLYKPTEEMA